MIWIETEFQNEFMINLSFTKAQHSRREFRFISVSIIDLKLVYFNYLLKKDQKIIYQ